MIIFKLRIISSPFIALAVLLLLSRNTEAKGGGRGGGRGRGRGGHHGGGGISSYSEEITISPYGNTFGSKGLPKDSYIYKDYYKYSDSSGFLISSLFYGAKMQDTDPAKAKKHYESISSENFYRKWDSEQDREWRKTTRGPYFENILPGDQKIFPASAVGGAAKAFGLVSLLPLNVPPGKPLMYCDNTDLIQSKIRINNENTYVCNKTKIEIECRNRFDHECVNKEVQCDKQNGVNENIYCSHGTLLSKTNMFCDIKYKYFNDTVTTVNCHEGKLLKGLTSFIPTTSTTTEFSYYKTTTTPKPLSFSANVHIFLLNLMGKSEVLETTTPESFPYPDSNAWHPEALTIPPTTTTTRRTTTRDPSYIWMKRVPSFDSNEEYRLIPLPKEDAEIADIMTHLPNSWVKVPISKVLETTTHQP